MTVLLTQKCNLNIIFYNHIIIIFCIIYYVYTELPIVYIAIAKKLQHFFFIINIIYTVYTICFYRTIRICDNIKIEYDYLIREVT